MGTQMNWHKLGDSNPHQALLIQQKEMLKAKCKLLGIFQSKNHPKLGRLKTFLKSLEVQPATIFYASWFTSFTIFNSRGYHHPKWNIIFKMVATTCREMFGF